MVPTVVVLPGPSLSDRIRRSGPDRFIPSQLRPPCVQREGFVATAAGFLGAALVLAILFWIVDAGAVLAAAGKADPVLLSAFVLAIVLWIVAWGVSLYNILRALGLSPSIHTAVLLSAAATFSNNVTPFGQAGGEPVTAALITRTLRTEYEISLASITSYDAVNVVPSVSFALFGALYYVSATDVTPGWRSLAGSVFAALLVLLAWWFRSAIRRRTASLLLPPVRRLVVLLPIISLASVTDWATGFVGALDRVAGQRHRLGVALGCSTLGWGLQAFSLWLTVLAVGATIPVYVPFLVIPLARISDLLPTPGGLGGNEAINATLLSVLTSASPAVITAAVTIHGVGGYLLSTGIGAAAASALGVRG